ncbi:MAG: hypothetical protein UY50_C0019G0017 [Parcubacteria group bacterium GW2011_GWA2_49_9]|nr:MAG: hypothetical protein UY50_C0019G0017 [Parcubacteria group bacterium GW2011_GWA2_49_9]
MELFVIFLIGVVAGVGGTLLWQWVVAQKKKPLDTARGKESLIERQKREKEEDKERIYGLLESNTPLTVGHVEMMLGIPESTATRYFDELEKEGKVRQVGTTGRDVHYERA